MKKENHAPIPKGILFVIGGKEDKGNGENEKEQTADQQGLEVLKTFKELIGKDDPVVELVTSASSVPDEMIEEYRKAFKEIGIQKVSHIHHNVRKEVCDDHDLEKRIMQADAFFFSGGDQLKLTSLYGGTEFIRILKEKYIYDNIVIAGTSSGAMALSTPMIYAGNKDVQQLAGEVKVTMGFEFIKDALIDTHFIDRSRFVRMAQVITTNPNSIGIGIEEDTAIIVRNGSEAEVVGTGLIIIVEGFSISNSNITESGDKVPLCIKDLKVHVMGRGAKYTIPKLNPPHK